MPFLVILYKKKISVQVGGSKMESKNLNLSLEGWALKGMDISRREERYSWYLKWWTRIAKQVE